MLAVTGGVPRYLEEINPNLPAEENIRRICFSKEGFLYSEFDQIFHDSFSRRALSYKRIVSALVSGRKTLSDLADQLKRDRGGDLSRYLIDLSDSGFITKDVIFQPGKKKASNLAKYRLKDNYLRFYLKYLEPIKDKIEKGLLREVALESLAEWETIMGLQFENLVLNNIHTICSLLAININTVKSASPYFQKKTQRKLPCQIDLLIETKFTFYVCEIKFRKMIAKKVISEVQEKIERLKLPKGYTVRPVLIYSGALASGVKKDGYFDNVIEFDTLLTASQD